VVNSRHRKHVGAIRRNDDTSSKAILRLHSLPNSLPAQLGTLGRSLVALIEPWAACGRAAAIDILMHENEVHGFHFLLSALRFLFSP
jgi:hypothetical protein